MAEHSLYLVQMEPREGAGDRSPFLGDHLSFIKDLTAQGRLFAGGPLVDDVSGQSLGRAVFVMRGQTIADVETVMREEPFILHGFRSFSVHAWRVSEGDVSKTSLAKPDSLN